MENRDCEKDKASQKITKRIIRSIKEAEKIESGKLPKRSAREMLRELRENKYNEVD